MWNMLASPPPLLPQPGFIFLVIISVIIITCLNWYTQHYLQKFCWETYVKDCDLLKPGWERSGGVIWIFGPTGDDGETENTSVFFIKKEKKNFWREWRRWQFFAICADTRKVLKIRVHISYKLQHYGKNVEIKFMWT